MRKFISAFALAAAVICFAGCSEEGQSSLDGGSSAEESSSSAESSENTESSSEVSESSSESSEESSAEVSSKSESNAESSQPSESEGVHISECKVPAWGVNDKTDTENVFEIGSEYETYRVLQTAEFEGETLKEIKVQVYVVAEGFDMDAFKAKWGFEPVWNGSYYEGTQAVPEEYAGKTVEEIKLAIAEPILKKYGSETYDGFPEIVMVEPTTAPDPAIEF